MRQRFSLLGKFSAMSLFAMVLLGLTIGYVLQHRIEMRALGRAAQLTEVFNRVVVAPNVTRGDLAGPLPPDKLRVLDRALAGIGDEDHRLRHAHVFSADGTTVYSDVRQRIGQINDGADFKRAISGELVANVERETGDDGEHVGSSLEVYVPLRLPGGREIDGVTEFYLDYGPTAAAIHDDKRALYLLLGGGMGLLYLSLFTLVKRASRRLVHQAQHDTLTGLPNRTALYERAVRVVASVRTFGGLAGLLLIDLDRFKEVNDTLGHDQGDRLLRDVAVRLRGALRSGDTLARLGGDEFAVLLRDLPDRAGAVELASRLLRALEEPFVVRGVTVQLEASIGVAICPDHGSDVTALVRRADVAMYDAKREQARVRVYDAARDPYSPARLQRVSELRTAMSQGELVLHYQPKVSVDGGEVTGVEALVRWEHPRHGLLGPAEFLPLAERTGLMGDLTRWVIDAALAQARAWQDAGVEVPIAINLAAANVLDAALPDHVAERLAHWGVPGARLTCELSYLKRLPLDEVKIDRAFVSGIVGDVNDLLIVRSTIDLARSLGLEVVAEGVEGKDVLDHLRTLRCHEAQGFHLSRPLPAEALVEWLGRWRPAPTQPV